MKKQIQTKHVIIGAVALVIFFNMTPIQKQAVKETTLNTAGEVGRNTSVIIDDTVTTSEEKGDKEIKPSPLAQRKLIK